MCVKGISLPGLIHSNPRDQNQALHNVLWRVFRFLLNSRTFRSSSRGLFVMLLMYTCTYGLKHPQKKCLKNEIFTSYVELFVFSGVDNIQVTFPFTMKYCESILDLRLIAGEYFVPSLIGIRVTGVAEVWENSRSREFIRPSSGHNRDSLKNNSELFSGI